MPKRIAILGSTGSIGCSALEVIEHLGPGYPVVALSAHSRIDKLAEQIQKFKPKVVAVTDESVPAGDLEGLGPEILRGPAGMEAIARRSDVDVVLAAVVGAAGLPAVLAAVESKKTVALANKESLVVAGSILMPLARRTGATIIPVDSEHSAVFQAMLAGKLSEVRRVILTASGGPFRSASLEEIQNATVADALNHPTWQMGRKITIDSATMFNKALELIEARWLFDLTPEQIEVVIHPESVVHSMVEFVDGSVIAQLSPPDMRTPIQYALTYPDRVEGVSRRVNWQNAFRWNFQPPDVEKFPAIRLAYDVARRGGTLGAVLNAANESAVQYFMAGKIAFGEISSLVDRTIAAHSVQPSPSLADLLEADRWARREVDSMISKEASRI